MSGLNTDARAACVPTGDRTARRGVYRRVLLVAWVLATAFLLLTTSACGVITCNCDLLQEEAEDILADTELGDPDSVQFAICRTARLTIRSIDCGCCGPIEGGCEQDLDLVRELAEGIVERCN